MDSLKNHKGKVFSSVFIAAIGVAFGVLPYFSIASIINNIVEGELVFRAYLPYILLILLGFLGSIIFHGISTIISHNLAYGIIEDKRKILSDKLSRLSMGEVERKSSGQWAQFMVETLDKIEKPIAHVIPEVFANILIPLVLLFVIFSLDWRIGLANLVTLPLGFLFTILMMRGYEAKSKRYQEASKAMNTAMVEYVQGIKLIKAFNKSASSYDKFKETVNENKDAMLDWYLSVCFSMTATAETIPATMIFVLPTGLYLFMMGRIEVGVLIMCILLSYASYRPLLKAMGHLDTMANIKVVLVEIDKIMSLPDLERGRKVQIVKDSQVEFREVDFSYEEGQKVLEKKDMRKELLTKSPLSLMFQLSIPAVIGMLVIGLYPLMDGIFAGNIIGQAAMTACGVALPLTFFNSGTSTLLGVGSASILSRAMGKGDKDTVDKIMGNLIYWVIFFSLIITVAGILLAPYFMDLVGAKGEIKELGVRYLRVIFLGSIFVNFTQSANMVMRGEGLMKRAMGIMALGAFINILLDPILMKSMGEYGIEGAAIATVTAQIIQAVITLYYFKNKSENVKIGKIRKERGISKEMFGVGVSAMIMQVFFMVQQTLLYKQAFKYGGDSAGTLMAATLRIYAFSFIPLWGMSQGLQPVVGTNFGAKEYGRVKESMKVFSIGGLLLAAVFWIPAQVFSRQILSAFNVDARIISEGVNNFRIFYSVFILYGLMVMSITFFQAIGDGKKAGIIVMLRQLILFVPAMLILPKFFGAGAVWWAEPVVDFLMIMVGLVMQAKSLAKMGRIRN